MVATGKRPAAGLAAREHGRRRRARRESNSDTAIDHTRPTGCCASMLGAVALLLLLQLARLAGAFVAAQAALVLAARQHAPAQPAAAEAARARTAARLQLRVSAVAGDGHHDGAGRAGPGVARDVAGVTAGCTQRITGLVAQLATGVCRRAAGPPGWVHHLATEAGALGWDLGTDGLAARAAPPALRVDQRAHTGRRRCPFADATKVEDVETNATAPHTVAAGDSREADHAVVGLCGQFRLERLGHLVQLVGALGLGLAAGPAALPHCRAQRGSGWCSSYGCKGRGTVRHSVHHNIPGRVSREAWCSDA